MKSIDRLDSWKEISAYINRDIRTCIKWGKTYKLPVYHIDENSSRSRVFAYKSEIDQWFKKRANIKHRIDFYVQKRGMLNQRGRLKVDLETVTKL